MKFKKGEKVEVLNEKGIPVSWHVAEILSGFGYVYLVKYDSYPGMSSEHKVETVSKTCVRPCQPLVQGVEDHVAGDVVEIFHEYAWKAAAVLNVVQGKRETKSRKTSIRATAVQKRYKVRLLGCSIESTVDGSNIRMKQTWQDGKWIMCKKVVSIFLQLWCHLRLTFIVVCMLVPFWTLPLSLEQVADH